MPLVRTVAAAVTHEAERIRGSRFVAHVAPVADEAAALAVVQDRRAAEPDASHHCWAFVLADGRARSADDGEPAGSAGEPIRRHIGGSGLVDVVVVVSRWFGGTKLGVGGLVRAYGGTAGQALALAEVVERPLRTRLSVTHPYELTGPVEAVLAAWPAEVAEAAYGEAVELLLDVPVEVVDPLGTALSEATAGRVRTRRP